MWDSVTEFAFLTSFPVLLLLCGLPLSSRFWLFKILPSSFGNCTWFFFQGLTCLLPQTDWLGLPATPLHRPSVCMWQKVGQWDSDSWEFETRGEKSRVSIILLTTTTTQVLGPSLLPTASRSKPHILSVSDGFSSGSTSVFSPPFLPPLPLLSCVNLLVSTFCHQKPEQIQNYKEFTCSLDHSPHFQIRQWRLASPDARPLVLSLILCRTCFWRSLHTVVFSFGTPTTSCFHPFSSVLNRCKSNTSPVQYGVIQTAERKEIFNAPAVGTILWLMPPKAERERKNGQLCSSLSGQCQQWTEIVQVPQWIFCTECLNVDMISPLPLVLCRPERTPDVSFLLTGKQGNWPKMEEKARVSLDSMRSGLVLCRGEGRVEH